MAGKAVWRKLATKFGVVAAKEYLYGSNTGGIVKDKNGDLSVSASKKIEHQQKYITEKADSIKSTLRATSDKKTLEKFVKYAATPPNERFGSAYSFTVKQQDKLIKDGLIKREYVMPGVSFGTFEVVNPNSYARFPHQY